MEEKRLPVPQLMIIICVLDSLIYIIAADKKSGGAFCMDTGSIDTGGIIAIAVALIGVAGGIWTQIVQFKKDSGRIGDVKSDTGAMTPQVGVINKNVEIIKDDVTRGLVPNMEKLSQIQSDTKALVTELECQRRIKSEVSGQSLNKDYFIASISDLYEKNAHLSSQLKAQQELNLTLQMENAALRKKCEKQIKKGRDIDMERE